MVENSFGGLLLSVLVFSFRLGFSLELGIPFGGRSLSHVLYKKVWGTAYGVQPTPGLLRTPEDVVSGGLALRGFNDPVTVRFRCFLHYK